MTKKEINKMIIKEFIKTVNDRYKVTSDFEDTEGGRMGFSLDVDNDVIDFEFHRSYLDVYTYVIKGEKNYNKAFEYKDYIGNVSKQIKEIFKYNNLI